MDAECGANVGYEYRRVPHAFGGRLGHWLPRYWHEATQIHPVFLNKKAVQEAKYEFEA